MLRCASCGTECHDDARFCKRCGQPLDVPSAPSPLPILDILWIDVLLRPVAKLIREGRVTWVESDDGSRAHITLDDNNGLRLIKVPRNGADAYKAQAFAAGGAAHQLIKNPELLGALDRDVERLGLVRPGGDLFRKPSWRAIAEALTAYDWAKRGIPYVDTPEGRAKLSQERSNLAAQAGIAYVANNPNNPNYHLQATQALRESFGAITPERMAQLTLLVMDPTHPNYVFKSQ